MSKSPGELVGYLENRAVHYYRYNWTSRNITSAERVWLEDVFYPLFSSPHVARAVLQKVFVLSDDDDLQRHHIAALKKWITFSADYAQEAEAIEQALSDPSLFRIPPEDDLHAKAQQDINDLFG